MAGFGVKFCWDYFKCTIYAMNYTHVSVRQMFKNVFEIKVKERLNFDQRNKQHDKKKWLRSYLKLKGSIHMKSYVY